MLLCVWLLLDIVHNKYYIVSSTSHCWFLCKYCMLLHKQRSEFLMLPVTLLLCDTTPSVSRHSKVQVTHWTPFCYALTHKYKP